MGVCEAKEEGEIEKLDSLESTRVSFYKPEMTAGERTENTDSVCGERCLFGMLTAA